MKFKITHKDSKCIFLLKLIYLIPFSIITYPFLVIYTGIIEIGNPIKDLIESYNWTGYNNRPF